jgi:hypothetical protein
MSIAHKEEVPDALGKADISSRAIALHVLLLCTDLT